MLKRESLGSIDDIDYIVLDDLIVKLQTIRDQNKQYSRIVLTGGGHEGVSFDMIGEREETTEELKVKNEAEKKRKADAKLKELKQINALAKKHGVIVEWNGVKVPWKTDEI